MVFETINKFRENNYFLSNMYPCDIKLIGLNFISSESIFQAFKCKYPVQVKMFQGLNGYQAKKLGRQIHLRDDWNDVKLKVMRLAVREKFEQNPYLLGLLLATGDKYLEEGNWWGDTFWGVSHGRGENNLGKILMSFRDTKRGELNEKHV